ncbi:MAG: HAD-IA family hydrolase [Actinomycetia bacterium]|nr:HAD-IA family hydrolase [Actinomycetes bacterium]
MTVPRPGIRAFWLILISLLGVACQATAEVAVVVEDDGSGTVNVVLAVDPEATALLIDPVGDLRLDDLTDAGWAIVEEPRVTPDGALEAEVSKAFPAAEQLDDVLAEIGGPILGGITLVRSRDFDGTAWTIEGAIDLRDGVDNFADEQLAALLAGRPFGETLEDLEDQLGAPLGSFLDLELAVTFMGVDSRGEVDAPLAVTVDAQPTGGVEARWLTTVGDQDVVAVSAVAERISIVPWVWLGLLIGAGVLILLIVLSQIARSLRRRGRMGPGGLPLPGAGRPDMPMPTAPSSSPGTETVRPVPLPGAAPDPTVPPEAVPGDQSTTPELVVLDGMGVVFEEGDDIRKLLVPYARERGCTLDVDEMISLSHSGSLGRLSSAELWEALGLEGDAADLDADYLALHRLTPGVGAFIARMRDRGIGVACLTNDLSTWSLELRRIHGLVEIVDPWIVSSTVGVRKPEPAMYEALRRTASIEPRRCLLIDDRIENLDAARELGYLTALFSPDATTPRVGEHAVLAGFGP